MRITGAIFLVPLLGASAAWTQGARMVPSACRPRGREAAAQLMTRPPITRMTSPVM
jgi:hypothetical protein